MRPPLLMALALLLALHCAAVQAADFHVDAVHGNDATGDGSAANPWRTLQHVLDDGLVETREWPSYPYQEGMTLVPKNSGAPVGAGDTIWLHSGYYGDATIERAYNAASITLAAQPGQSPQLRTLSIHSAENWIVRDLDISPSFATSYEKTTIVEVEDHNYFGPTADITLVNLDIFSIDDASAWGPAEWVDLASSGVGIGADHTSLVNSRVRNVRFGISVGGDHVTVRNNLIDRFSADGMRGLGDYGTFEYNRIQNNLIGSDIDGNHDDGFQSWSFGPGGVGTGAVVGVVLRGNVFINATDPADPLRSTMQGIGCFDGFFIDWTVENNVVITDHWHGISFYGMRDSRIINNTVMELVDGNPGPPWLMVHAHKDGRPSENVVVRNNLATDFSLAGNNLVSDHNLQFVDASALFVAPPINVHLRAGAAAIDAGSTTLAPPLDADRVPRPQGQGVDLGAYEFRPDAIFGDGFEP